MAQQWIRSLLDLRAYPEKTTTVNLLQTHVSFLFITDCFVYKIKKSVNMGFLDFTTLDRRRFYCEEEVRLNRRLCPDIYLGVVDIRETPAGAVINGKGTIIDYAVKMKRLPEERMLSRLLQEDQATPGDMKRIAATIANFHATAERGPDIDQYGSIENICYNWEENLKQLHEYVGVSLTKEQLLCISSWVKHFIDRQRDIFDLRRAEGFIRECDGDIHAGNICITDRIYIFDCIEFNKRFRCCDTAADLAFLLMDLDYNGKITLSRTVRDQYQNLTGDHGLSQVIDFYKIYRAVVRGKVESFRLKDPAIPGDEKDIARQRAISYFRLSRGYIVRQQLRPTVFLTCGLTGSGKSVLASALSFELGLESIIADVVRKEITGTAGGNLSGYGEGIYDSRSNDATYRELLVQCQKVVASGSSVIVDATFRRKPDRSCFRSRAAELGAEFVLLLTQCPDDIIKERLDRRKNDPDAVSDGRWEIFQQQKEEFQPVGPEEGLTIPIDTSLPLLDNVDRVLTQLGLMSCDVVSKR